MRIDRLVGHELLECLLQIGGNLRVAATVTGSLLPAIALCGLFLPGLTITPSAVLCSCALAVAAALIFLDSAGRARSDDRQPAFGVGVAGCQAPCAAGPMYAIPGGKPVTLPLPVTGCLAGLVLAACESYVLRPLLRD